MTGRWPLRSTASHVLGVRHSGLRIFCRLTLSTLIPLTADHTFPVTTTRYVHHLLTHRHRDMYHYRSPISSDAARAMCSTPTPRPASPQRRLPSARVGTGVRRTADAAMTATRTAPAPPSRVRVSPQCVYLYLIQSIKYFHVSFLLFAFTLSFCYPLPGESSKEHEILERVMQSCSLMNVRSN